MSDILNEARGLLKRLTRVVEKEEKKLNLSKMPTIVNIILDQSGSMGVIREGTIEGFNEYIEGLKESNNAESMYVSLTLFDTAEIERRHVVTPLHRVKKLNFSNYCPNAGTPLYDAVVKTLQDAEDRLDDDFDEYAAIAVIITDGEENSSREYSQKDFTRLKKKLEKNGNWTFIFLGANQDSWGNASNWGYSRGNVMDYSFDNSGIQNAFRSVGRGTVMMATAAQSWASSEGKDGSLSTDKFFAEPKKK